MIDVDRLIAIAIAESQCVRYAPESCKSNWGEQHVDKWCRGCLLWILVCEYRLLQTRLTPKDSAASGAPDHPHVGGVDTRKT